MTATSKVQPILDSESPVGERDALRFSGNEPDQLPSGDGRSRIDRQKVWAPPSERPLPESVEKTDDRVVRLGVSEALPPSVLERLAQAPIGRFYRKRLKQFAWIRLSVQWVWRHAMPLYVRHVAPVFASRESSRWRPLVCISEQARSTARQKLALHGPEKIITPAPGCVSFDAGRWLKSPHRCYEFPAAYVVTIERARVQGGSNFVMLEDRILCHDLFDPARDFTSEELHGRFVIDGVRGKIRWLAHSVGDIKIETGASFLDACAPNYAHWTTEVLPRIAAFCSVREYEHVPLLIDDALHINLHESVRAVAGGTRTIFRVPRGQTIEVARLVMTSVLGYVPFERRKGLKEGHSHGRFSPWALGQVRTKLAPLLPGDDSENWPRRIYLRRTTGIRKVENAREIETLLLEKGLTIIEPERLTFRQQVKLFSRAELVVASSGAALANLVFAPTDARVIILIAKMEGTSYWYWQNMACASGKVVDYVLGDIEDSKDVGIHSDFVIRISDLEKTLGEVNEAPGNR